MRLSFASSSFLCSSVATFKRYTAFCVSPSALFSSIRNPSSSAEWDSISLSRVLKFAMARFAPCCAAETFSVIPCSLVVRAARAASRARTCSRAAAFSRVSVFTSAMPACWASTSFFTRPASVPLSLFCITTSCSREVRASLSAKSAASFAVRSSSVRARRARRESRSVVADSIWWVSSWERMAPAAASALLLVASALAETSLAAMSEASDAALWRSASSSVWRSSRSWENLSISVTRRVLRLPECARDKRLPP
mmetsp:Transcript_48027/g.114314  ORF Transcript_48027/g.114314 Transcript_48027/m.114314 type:complete len:254 (-) Transcript_48027:2722-3483(-)